MKFSDLWRVLAPGLAFQAVLIGGGYATGRELISFYFTSGPLGGLFSMAITAGIWSVSMMLVLEISRRFHVYDYKSFFKKLIGPGWIAFETAYIALLIVVLSIVGAAAGEIFSKLLSTPTLVGTAALIAAATVVLFIGSSAVRRVLSYWSIVIYICYFSFFILFTSKFGGLSLEALRSVPIGEDVFLNGLRYAGVNINCFASILFLAVALKSQRETATAGAFLGPIAMLPGMLFYFAMMGYYPQVGDETVPLTFLLDKLQAPVFSVVFQIAILGTLLQTGVGMVHAVNERVDAVYAERGREMPHWLRGLLALVLMVFSITIAEWIGLVALIDKGYGVLSWVFIAIIFAPLFTVGLWILFHSKEKPVNLKTAPIAERK